MAHLAGEVFLLKVCVTLNWVAMVGLYIAWLWHVYKDKH